MHTVAVAVGKKSMSQVLLNHLLTLQCLHNGYKCEFILDNLETTLL